MGHCAAVFANNIIKNMNFAFFEMTNAQICIVLTQDSLKMKQYSNIKIELFSVTIFIQILLWHVLKKTGIIIHKSVKLVKIR